MASNPLNVHLMPGGKELVIGTASKLTLSAGSVLDVSAFIGTTAATMDLTSVAAATVFNVNTTFTIQGDTGAVGCAGIITLKNGCTIDGGVTNATETDTIRMGFIGICADASPAVNPPVDSVSIYYDGTDIKAVNNAGQHAILNKANFA